LLTIEKLRTAALWFFSQISKTYSMTKEIIARRPWESLKKRVKAANLRLTTKMTTMTRM